MTTQLHPNFYLGLPAWAYPGWTGDFFTDQPNRLASYASVFNSVEGNTTFYRTPDADTVERWRDAVADTEFRFCLKLPKSVTHEREFDRTSLDRFLNVIEPLDPHLGPLLVQFPAHVGPRELPRIDATLSAIGSRQSCVVEVRHPAFFQDRNELKSLLQSHHASRVSLDARPIHEGDRTHPEVLAALHKKPDLPVLTSTVEQRAFIRLVLHPDLHSNEPWMEEWVAQAAGYLSADIETWMMIHCPNNQHCPTLARDFTERLGTLIDLAPLPPWPIPTQMSLV
ncbi:MAG: DUF72 domain-containing protein [Pseudomonadota bacterium]